MDQKAARKLERELEKAIIEVIGQMGLKKLPLPPSHQTMRMMAKAAVAVYEAAVDRPDEGSTEKPESE